MSVILGDMYRFIFGGPGPDVTVVIPEAINEDGTYLCHDLLFDLKFSVPPDKLIRVVNPVRYEAEAFLRYKGEWFK